ncbi:MAG TPA: MarR family transcriptional regulator [Deinococcales bacterium]|nr:MarR family transcriptional regulator [Deinococcales bacterium]
MPSREHQDIQAITSSLGLALAQAARAHRQRTAEALAPLGLHVGQEMILLQLWQQDGLTQVELARRLRVEEPTVSRALTSLERAGLLERCRQPGLGRAISVRLTNKGRALQEPVAAAWTSVEQRLLTGLLADERQAAAELLHRIARRLQDNTEAGGGA